MERDLHIGLWSRRRIRLVRQTEFSECGLACLAMIATYHGSDTDLSALRRRFPLSTRGVTLKSLVLISDQMGFSSRAVKLPLESVPRLTFPAILHWNLNHFVVAERVERGRVLIHDPAGASRWYGLTDISPYFTGVALELHPANSFRTQVKQERLALTRLWKNVYGLKTSIAQTLSLSIVIQLFAISLPYYMQIAVDQVLPALDWNLMAVIALGFGLLTIVNSATTVLRSYVLLIAGAALSFGIANNIARKLFRLPISWFERRHVGDVLSRFQSIHPIQEALTQSAGSAVVDGALTSLTLIIMFFYSSTLALIAAIAFALYLAVRLLTFPMQLEANTSEVSARAKEQSVMIESLRGITTLRLFNREVARHALWQIKLTDAVNAGIVSARINLWQGGANTLIFGLETVVSIWVGISLVMAGGFSVGMMFAFLAYKAQFIKNATSLGDQVISFKMLGLHLDRLSDIALSDEDPSFDLDTPTVRRELNGHIELNDVTFRYSTTEPPVLNGVDLVIEPGSHVVITGPSGGGKSTLVKVLLGLIEPDSGQIRIDGLLLKDFGHRNYREQIGAVLQDDNLFAGSIADNIALFDDDPDFARVKAAAATASIDEDIMRMPMGYETLVGDMGSSLSGGQKQRVLLARALYRRPKLLIMDEGTAHLDASAEAEINAAIKGMGITRIVIAHRKETIAAADRICYFINGAISSGIDLLHLDAITKN
ncbi:peptidase domain-containing ABC transporter [Nitrospirillum sp. BR 11164]|uniref:peptidase domain-containing ABC transporter n=1 Tax=Nitrospirillum sp. BR 11164 TaxID=3104324 RepID=UPI002B001722|nr:peptidase domain-containing ABC transporter [Nitrospirillum sp. BR 11164]MEA1647842.1 peptidase domain-containing ABC transporter [Nitrospirillum sp. BR 11164]